MIRADDSVVHTWAIVLAGGAGTRLRSLTTDANGISIPKQYWSLRGGRSLLGDAIARATQVAPLERTVVVVAREHETWWSAALAELPGLPAENVVVQPRGRGTAPGILLPLRSILERDREARVAVLPSDHFVRDEWTFERALRQSLRAIDGDAERVALLGIAPDAAESDYGWIVPSSGGTAGELAGPLSGVERFVEKPPRELALELQCSGGLWNSFVFSARATALERLYLRRLPELHAAFAKRSLVGASHEELDALYAELGESDFSRQVLQGAESSLDVLRVPECGWTDLGTPERVAECLATCAQERERTRRSVKQAATPVEALASCALDLSSVLRSLSDGAGPRAHARSA